MTPGPVSDSYDPEFGTAANAARVAKAVRILRDRLTAAIGSEELHSIIVLACTRNGPRRRTLLLSERELRILRFCVDRALESI